MNSREGGNPDNVVTFYEFIKFSKYMRRPMGEFDFNRMSPLN